MRAHTYTKFSPEMADAVDLQSLLDNLADLVTAAQSFLRTDARARSLYQLKPGKALRVQTDEQRQFDHGQLG